MVYGIGRQLEEGSTQKILHLLVLVLYTLLTDTFGVLPSSFDGVQYIPSALGQSPSCPLLPHSVEGGGRTVEGEQCTACMCVHCTGNKEVTLVSNVTV